MEPPLEGVTIFPDIVSQTHKHALFFSVKVRSKFS